MTVLLFLAFLAAALALGGWIGVRVSERTVDRESPWQAAVLSVEFNEELDAERWRWGK